MDVGQIGWGAVAVAMALGCGSTVPSPLGNDSTGGDASESASEATGSAASALAPSASDATTDDGTGTSTGGVEGVVLLCSDIEAGPHVDDVAALEGGAVLVGLLDSDAWFARFDAAGQLMWSVAHDGPGNDEVGGDRATEVSISPSGAIIVAGWESMGRYFPDENVSTDATRWWLASLDDNGNETWSLTDPEWVPFAPEEQPIRLSRARDLITLTSGEIVVLNEFTGEGAEVRTFDGAGGSQSAWATEPGISPSHLAIDGPYAFVAGQAPLGGGYALTAYDLTGAPSWSFEPPLAFSAPAGLDARGSKLAAAYTDDVIAMDAAVKLLWMTPAGRTEWVQTHDPTTTKDFSFAVAIDSAGSIVVAGVSAYDPNNGSGFAWVRKYGPSGDLTWSIEHPEPGGSFVAIDLDAADGVVLVGNWFPEPSQICRVLE